MKTTFFSKKFFMAKIMVIFFGSFLDAVGPQPASDSYLKILNDIDGLIPAMSRFGRAPSRNSLIFLRSLIVKLSGFYEGEDDVFRPYNLDFMVNLLDAAADVMSKRDYIIVNRISPLTYRKWKGILARIRVLNALMRREPHNHKFLISSSSKIRNFSWLYKACKEEKVFSLRKGSQKERMCPYLFKNFDLEFSYLLEEGKVSQALLNAHVSGKTMGLLLVEEETWQKWGLKSPLSHAQEAWNDENILFARSLLLILGCRKDIDNYSVVEDNIVPEFYRAYQEYIQPVDGRAAVNISGIARNNIKMAAKKLPRTQTPDQARAFIESFSEAFASVVKEVIIGLVPGWVESWTEAAQKDLLKEDKRN